MICFYLYYKYTLFYWDMKGILQLFSKSY